jgi:hypothetical protein
MCLASPVLSATTTDSNPSGKVKPPLSGSPGGSLLSSALRAPEMKIAVNAQHANAWKKRFRKKTFEFMM